MGQNQSAGLFPGSETPDTLVHFPFFTELIEFFAWNELYEWINFANILHVASFLADGLVVSQN